MSDTRVIPSSGNVFVDLGFDEAEVQVRALHVELLTRLREQLKAQGCTPVEAARRLHVSQPSVSALMKGVGDDFSIDLLLVLATRAGLNPELCFAA